MHYDKKIAIALGVLLIGVVGAFFFRRDFDPRISAPKLADAKSLDAKIADKPLRPYDSPAIVNTGRATPTNDNRAVASDNVPAVRVNPEAGFPSAMRVNHEEPSNARGATTLGPPEPIKPANGESEGATFAEIPAPDHNSAWKSGPAGRTSSRNNTAASRRQRKTVAPKTYQVKPGDTLSGIAYKLLGRSSRYREIFEANRDVMRNPNDIRPGMVLRIPDRRQVGERTPARKTAGRDKTVSRRGPALPTVEFMPPPKPSRSRPTPSPKFDTSPRRSPLSRDRRFAPVRRSPFILNHKRREAPDWSTRGSTDRPFAPQPPTESKVRANRVPSPSKPKLRTYVIKRGDTLEGIAVKFYGTRRAMKRIIDANRGRIDRVDRLYPGTRLVLP